jgi:hypothetical protein
MMRADHSLFADLFAIDGSRMHLIALAVAHLNLPVPPEIGPLLVRASARQVLNQVLGQPPVGLRRALSHLPDAVHARWTKIDDCSVSGSSKSRLSPAATEGQF